jgi:hypothetical protein
MTTTPDLLRTPKAAEVLGITPGKLRRLKMLGQGPKPAMDPGRGGCTLYERSELEQFKANQGSK